MNGPHAFNPWNPELFMLGVLVGLVLAIGGVLLWACGVDGWEDTRKRECTCPECNLARQVLARHTAFGDDHEPPPDNPSAAAPL
jgi:hypothetical protein